MFYENIRGLVQLMRAQIYSLCRKYFLVYSFDILVLSLEGFKESIKSFLFSGLDTHFFLHKELLIDAI
jgi:hypothetical protein